MYIKLTILNHVNMAIFELVKYRVGGSELWKIDIADGNMLELKEYDAIIVKIIAKKKTKDTKLTKYVDYDSVLK